MNENIAYRRLMVRFCTKKKCKHENCEMKLTFIFIVSHMQYKYKYFSTQGKVAFEM